jgi:thioredoxin reductase (NADPH)
MAKPVILAVDDDPQVLRSIARDLRNHYGEHYRILRAASGAEAIEAVKEVSSKGDGIALLLSDQRMPNMDGVSFLGEAMELVPDAKRVLLTAYADTDAAISAINRSQVDYYLLKPWDPPEEKLFPILDDLLEDWRASYRPGYDGIKVVGDRWSPLSHQIKDFLARNQVPYQFYDVENSEEGRAVLERSVIESDVIESGVAGSTVTGSDLGMEDRRKPSSLPIVVLPDGERLASPSLAELADRIGLQTRAEKPFYDLVIVGAGPAGLASAVYGGSEGLRTILIEREAPGGQAGTSSRIENYLGFPAGLSGGDLARRAVAQARKFGVEILAPMEVASLRIEGPYKHLTLSDGREITGHALMLSTGVSWRKLTIPGAEALAGKGIYYGAAMTEAAECAESIVYIVGAGNSAGQAAMFFKEYAKRVYMLVRGDDLGAKMSQYLATRIEDADNIEVMLNTEVHACQGEQRLTAMTLYNNVTGQSEDVPANYLFVFIGAAPRTDWLGDQVARDKRGFILTGTDLEPGTHLKDWPFKRSPTMLETNVPGIFAAGDVRHESVKRVASAVGEGSVSVHFVHRYLSSL